jgi:hypothetical protein
MSLSIRGRFREQVRFLRRQFLQDGEVPFTDALSESAVAQALKALDVVWLDRTTLSSGAAPVAFARSTGKPSNYFLSNSRFVKHVYEFSSPGSAAEA